MPQQRGFFVIKLLLPLGSEKIPISQASGVKTNLSSNPPHLLAEAREKRANSGSLLKSQEVGPGGGGGGAMVALGPGYHGSFLTDGSCNHHGLFSWCSI